MRTRARVRVCMCVCVCLCVRACVRACMRAYIRAYVRLDKRRCEILYSAVSYQILSLLRGMPAHSETNSNCLRVCGRV